MRFCPFCSAENADDLAVCQACGRRLPPLPPRRGPTRNAPPTGIQLPNRPAGSASPPARRPGSSVPPPLPASAYAPMPAAVPTAVAPHDTSPEATTVEPEPVEATIVAPPLDLALALAEPPVSAQGHGPTTGAPAYAPSGASGPTSGVPAVELQLRDSAPALPPPPSPSSSPSPSASPSSSPSGDDHRRQLANALNPGPAAQRRDASAEPRIPADRRARPDSKQPLSPTALTRPHSPSQPPPVGFGQPAAKPVPPSGPNHTALGIRPQPLGRRAGSVPPPLPGSGPHGAPAPGAQFGGDTFVTDNDFSRPQIQALVPRDGVDPPPTRIRTDALVDRPFTPAQVLAVPEIPEPGLVKAARYTYIFARARWQRRGAIKQLGIEIRQDTDALDQVLGALGAEARAARVEGRVFSAENSAISDAQERINNLNKEGDEVEARKAEENSKFVDVERERNAKLTEAERMVGEAQSELSNLEGQRRSMRDKRKELERRLKAYLKAADDHDRQAGSAPLGDQRQELRRVAEGHRKEAAALEPERQDIDRRLGSIERPINELMARLDAGKAELDAAKRSLNDAREGHTHRLAELDAEQKRKTREIGLAESEIQRRLVTLGTLVNLNRIEDPRFAELYGRIDRLRGAITARTTEIEKLAAEREAYDRGALVRGVATIGGAILILIALIVIVAAIL
ncbi:MAG: hypothetical protein ABI467_15685 [Kofleriaceae bacterium]